MTLTLFARMGCRSDLKFYVVWHTMGQSQCSGPFLKCESPTILTDLGLSNLSAINLLKSTFTFAKLFRAHQLDFQIFYVLKSHHIIVIWWCCQFSSTTKPHDKTDISWTWFWRIRNLHLDLRTCQVIQPHYEHTPHHGTPLLRLFLNFVQLL